jgi:KaiC/GvpD/RAD55 family RecA-like ATPase
MSDTFQSLQRQLTEAAESLRLIQERKTEFVLKTDVPLQLVKDERRLEAQIADLQKRLDQLAKVPCPYRGLEPFEAEHAEFYFGRGPMLERLLTKMGETSFIAVVGPSGCGKSSLVRAGLVTALRDGALPGSQNWAIRIFCPGRDPLWALVVPLVALLEPESSEVDRLADARRLAQYLRERTLSMTEVVARLREVHTDLSRVLLVADQFEELYTECDNESIRQAFVSALLAAAESEWVTVVLTLRADFYGRILEDRSLARRVDGGLVNVLPMSEDERRAAIEGPALATGRAFEPGLVERILQDVANAPGGLPLLEFALTGLWARQTAEGQMTHSACRAIGEVQGAVARRAEAVYTDLREKYGGETVRRIFLRLLHYREGTEETRRRATLQSLVTPRTPYQEVSSVVGALTDARLLVTGRNEATGTVTVEVAHEAVIQGWARLRHWLSDDRAFGLWRERLAVTQQAWEDTKHDEGTLLRGALLAETERWLAERGDDLNEAERIFIEDSLALRERERAARKREGVLLGVAGGLFGGALGGLVGAIVSYAIKRGFDENVLSFAGGGALIGALFGGGISLGMGLGGAPGSRRGIFRLGGGIVAGMLLGALLGPSYGVELNPEGSMGSFVLVGILLGAAYGGGIALSVAIGRKPKGRKSLLVCALLGILVGGLVGLAFESELLSAFIGLGIALGTGIADARFQQKATGV